MNKKKINWSEIPISDSLPAFNFFEWKKLRLKAGVNVFLIEDTTQPLVTMKVLFKRGAVLEPLPGLANLTAMMLTKGTSKHPAKDIAGKYEHYGISLNSVGRWDDSFLQFISLSEYFDKAATILFDCMLNSSFPEIETEKMKKNQIANIKQNWSDSNYLAQLAFSSAFFSHHPYGRAVSGLSKDVLSISNEHCRHWYRKLLCETEIFIVIAGNYNEQEAIAKIEKELAGREFMDTTPNNVDLPVIRKDKPVAIIGKPDAKQTSLRIGKPGMNRNNPDFPIYQLANTIYGGYFKSRLNNLIREELGYTYGISSVIDTRLYGNSLVIGADLNMKSSKDAVEKIIEQLELFSTVGVDQEEHSTAIQYMTGAFVRMMETPQQKAGMLAGKEFYSLPDDYYDTFLETIRDSTLEDVLRVQKKFFKPENLVIACCGDTEYLEGELSDFGNVEILENPEI